MKGRIGLALSAIVLLCAAVFAGSKVIGILSEYQNGTEAYEEMTQYVIMPEVSTVPTKVPEKRPEPDEPFAEEVQKEEEIAFPVVDFEALKKINPEVVGWITIEGTRINYPFVQGTDNNYYLKRMIDGEHNSSGSIFMDYRNEADFSDRNIVLYGHNMNNGSMFADVRKYRTQEFYEEHPRVLLMTPQGNKAYDVIAAYVVKTNGAAWQMDFESDEEALNWAKKAMEKSAFDSSAVPDAQARFLTLSTCTYEVDNARFVLVAMER